MFSDVYEKHIPEIGNNGSNFTADFCESGAFGAGLSVLVGLKLALLNPVYFASPNFTIKSGAHVSRDMISYVSNPQFCKTGAGLDSPDAL